jgi:chromosomal replication initiation ATPase DnaA
MNQQRIVQLKTMPYVEYLQTPEWLAKRELVLKRDSHCCHVCSGSDSLHVHHLTYERRGNEDLDDLVVLCRICHFSYHQSLTTCPDHLRDWPGDAHFETFDDLPSTKSALSSAINFALRPAGWLVLTGLSGCGKTHLASSIAKQRKDAGDIVVVQTMSGLLSELRAASIHSKGWNNYDKKVKAIRGADLLVIDDYGTVDTEWERVELFKLFNYRYNGMLPMVVTSSDIHLSTVDPFVASRMSDSEIAIVVKMEHAADYRRSKEY